MATLAVGTSLGGYEILTLIGSGGMGEVYRARDPRLDRHVAIKVLPEALSSDTDRISRFEREAHALAALNHPNIAAIYGFEASTGVHALVMELVDGPTLADRIAQGPIPLDEALTIAQQIAEALEAAHDRGIIHRDLKPANVKVRSDGMVKVLDFGLAKSSDASVDGDGAPGIKTRSPTMTTPAGTLAGVILGTAAYMAPEQAAAKPIDRRVDIWSFGVILWEMLTGRRLFDGETIAHTLAAVLRADIDLNGLPAPTPTVVRWLLARCLERDPKNRLRDIGEARVALAKPHVTEGAVRPASQPKLPWLLAGAFALIALIAVAITFVRSRQTAPPQLPLTFAVSPPVGARISARATPAVSPDGRRVAFVAVNAGKTELWLRDLGAAEARPLPGTDDAAYPFWSPDGERIAFFTGDKLKTISSAGDTPVTISDTTGRLARGGAWSPNGVIVFASNAVGGLMRVAAAGGDPTPATTIDRQSGEVSHRYPWFLPDGEHFLYTATDAETTTVYVTQLGSSTRRAVVKTASNAVYAPPGYLLYLRGRTLLVQRFNADTTEVSGEPVPVAEQVDYASDNMTGIRLGLFSVSQRPDRPLTLAYRVDGPASDSQMVIVDRTGQVLSQIGSPGDIRMPVVSPDRQTIAAMRLNPRNGFFDLWLHDVSRNAQSRFSFSPSGNTAWPVWSPDGSQIVFLTSRNGVRGIFRRQVNGATEEEMLAEVSNALPTDWSHDGQFVIFQRLGVDTSFDVWVVPLAGDRKPFPYLQTRASERRARLSPNGRWLAYGSTETGREEIFVQTFPKPGGKWQISTEGGVNPVWSHDGKELFFVSGDQSSLVLMSADIAQDPEFKFAPAKVALQPLTSAGGDGWFDITNDGRFVITRPVEQPAGLAATVVVNWTPRLGN